MQAAPDVFCTHRIFYTLLLSFILLNGLPSCNYFLFLDLNKPFILPLVSPCLSLLPKPSPSPLDCSFPTVLPASEQNLSST